MVENDPSAPVVPDAQVRTPQLSRELSEFLVELSLAMHKHAIYPRGHPLLAKSVEAVHRSLTGLLDDRPALSIGVARKQLIIEGVATGATHPLLGELANKFHRHHIGALKFTRGLTGEELGDALETVGIEPQKDEHPLGMRPDVLETLWTNVKMFPLTYDRLELLDETDAPEAEKGGSAEGRGYAAQLWVGLATAAIAADRGEEPPMDPEQVAAAIDAHDREPAYDQIIVGYLLQIAREVREDETPVSASIGLKRRISKLVGALQPDTLRRLLDMGGDTLQRRQFVLDATQGMSVDAVIDLVRAAASAEGQTISTSLVRMLTKLATHAGGEPTLRSRNAEGEFRSHVERLVTSWSLNDPNPLAYSAALEQMSRTGADGAASGQDARFPCEPTRVVAMALELDVTGESVARAVTSALRAEQLAELLDLLDAAPAAHVATIEYIWTLIDAAAPLPALLAMPRVDHQLARRVVARTGLSAAPALLAALSSAAEGAQRDRLMGYLASLGPDVAPVIGARLASAHPSLAREFLTCLIKLAPPLLPVGARPFLNHADAAVRREATKLLLAYDETRDVAMSAALRDEDERVIYAGLLAAQDTCSPEAAASIRERMDRGDISESAGRAAAVKAVSHIIDDDTLEWLLKRVVVAGGLLRRARLAPTSPELLAALTALAVRWEHHPMAAPVLTLARSSTSSTVRAAAQQGGFKAPDERGRTT